MSNPTYPRIVEHSWANGINYFIIQATEAENSCRLVMTQGKDLIPALGSLVDHAFQFAPNGGVTLLLTAEERARLVEAGIAHNA